MARIRSIKPDFWTDEKTVELDFEHRLLFIGIWNFSDDQGYLDYSVKRIKMQVFPGDDVDVYRGLARLHALGLVRLYRTPEGLVLHVRHWDKHQRVSNPAKPRYTASDLHECDWSDTTVQSPREDSRVIGKGREGKGREEERARPAEPSLSPTASKNAASGGQTLALIETAPKLTAGLLVSAWCDGWSEANGGRPPPPASVKRVSGSCRQIASATPAADVDAWRDGWTAARDAGKANRLDVVGQLTDNGRSGRRPERSAASFLDIANQTNPTAIGA